MPTLSLRYPRTLKLVVVLLLLVAALLLATRLVAAPLLAEPCQQGAEPTGCVDVSLSPDTLTADFFVGDTQIGSGGSPTRLSVTARTSVRIEARNVRDSAQDFGDTFIYSDAATNVWVDEGQTRTYTLYPQKVFIKGFLDFTCDIRNVNEGENVACHPIIDGAQQQRVAPGETVVYPLEPGEHQIRVEVIGNQAQLWDPAANEHTTTISAGFTRYLNSRFDKKGLLTINLDREGIRGDLYVNDELVQGQGVTAQLWVAPYTSLTIEGKNFNDPQANGIYRWRDAVGYANLSPGQERTVTLRPQKEFLQGFVEITCSIRNLQPDQNVFCKPTLGEGQQLERIAAGETQTYTLDPGPHTFTVELGNNPQNVTDSTTVNAYVYAGQTSRYTAALSLDPPAVASTSGSTQTTTTQSTTTAAPVVTSGAAAGGGFELGGQVRGGEFYDAMRSAGMTYVKYQIRGLGSTGGAAAAINEGHANGFKVLISVLGEHDIDFGAWTNYYGQLAALGPDAIEIWNEPNFSREWPAQHIGGDKYVNLMLAPAYNAIKSTNPGVMVISGAPTPTGAFQGCSYQDWLGMTGCNDDTWINQLRAAGGASYMDCVGVHYNAGATSPYASSGHPAGGHYSWYFGSMVSVYRSVGRPLCFTEFGYAVGPSLPAAFGWANDNTVQEQAQWLGEAAALASRSNVRLMIVWNVGGFGGGGGDPQGAYRIVRDNGCPACETLGRVMGVR